MYLSIIPGFVLIEELNALLNVVLEFICMLFVSLGACRLVCVASLILRVVQVEVVQHMLCSRKAFRGTAVRSHDCKYINVLKPTNLAIGRSCKMLLGNNHVTANP